MPEELHPALRGHIGRPILSAFPPLWPITYNVLHPSGDPEQQGHSELLCMAWTYGLYAHYMLESCKDGNCWSPDYCSRGRKLWDQEMEFRKTWKTEAVNAAP